MKKSQNAQTGRGVSKKLESLPTDRQVATFFTINHEAAKHYEKLMKKYQKKYLASQ
jgi:hypothetical protein